MCRYFYKLKNSSEINSKQLGITEVCGNLFSENPTNIVLFGYFSEISISGYFQHQASPKLPMFYINQKPIPEKYFTLKTLGQKTHFSVAIPTPALPGEKVYEVVITSPNFTEGFAINMAGPLPNNLEDKELFFYLKNQIWYYHQIVSESTKRVYAIEQSLSWKITRPLRLFLDILQKLPLLLTSSGWKALKNLLSTKSQKAPLISKLNKVISTDSDTGKYQHFLHKKAWEDPTPEEIKKIINEFKLQPKISLLTPVYNCPPEFLKACVDSVLAQSYTEWELCLYDDFSTNPETINYLISIQNKHDRIKVKFGQSNLHIAEATNQCFEMSTGNYIALLDHDDTLHPHALYEIVSFVNKNPDIDFIYSDEDKISVEGVQTDPYFKSDFNIDLFLSNNYLNHFSVFKTEIFKQAGKFRKGFEGSQDYDLFLRILSITKKFGHIPKVLYHWRKVPGSTADTYQSKSYPEKAALKALTEYIQREKIDGVIEKGFFPGCFRLKRTIKTKPKVSIIIPFRDEVTMLKDCLKSIWLNTEYNNYEIILVNNQSTKEETLNYLNNIKTQVTVLDYNQPFNYSAINNFAVKHAKGEVLLFLNNDIEAREKGWLEAMIEHIERPEIGAVGAKLSYPDNTLQHAGVVLGINGVAGHVHKHLPSISPGYFMRANAIQNLSACTAACLMVKKAVFEKIGGFNEKNLTIAFNDIDLCLEIRKLGYKITYTPYAHLTHYESKSRGFEDTPEKIKRFESEIKFMQQKWGETLFSDPYYNPNLTLNKEDFSLKM